MRVLVFIFPDDIGHKCNMCEAEFPLAHKLSIHKWHMHCKAENGKRLKISTLLNELVNEETLYSSDSECDYTFRTTVLRAPHSKQYAASAEVSIDQSSKVEIASNPLNIKQINSNAGFSCAICQKLMLHKSSLSRHLKHMHKICTTENSSICKPNTENEVDSPFARQLAKQTEQIEMELSPPFSCSMCGRKYKIVNNLYQHYRYHHNQTPSIVPIGQTKVMANATENQKSLQCTCSVCGQSFQNRQTICQHMRRVHAIPIVHFMHDTDGQLFECDHCDKQFSSTRNYEAHKRVHVNLNRAANAKAQSYLCNVCGKRYMDAYHLKVHMYRHSGERPYKCDICKKGFIIMNSLKEHMHMHSGEKPFVCEVTGCGKAFAHSSGKRQHFDCVHNTVKRFECDYCHKRYAKRVHML